MKKAPKCPRCGSTNTYWKEDRRIYCKDCHQRSRVPESKYGDKEDGYIPSILILDIETAPSMAFVWRYWKENINIDQVVSDWFILSWSAKWLDNDNVMGDVLTPVEAINQDDKRIMESIYNLLNKADIVIAHNGKKFDLPKMKLRFLKHGFPPPAPYQLIDTLDVWKREFGSASNKLDYLNGVVLELPRKVETGGFQLWADCYSGDRKALATMLEYNMNDVEILEQNYLAIRGWIHSHPNLSLYTSKTCCPNCGSDDYVKTKDHYFTSVSKFEAYRCNNCGAPFRGRNNIVAKEDKAKIISPCAR